MQNAEQILQFLPMAVILLDGLGRFLDANAAACQLFKLDCQNHRGKMHQAVLPDLNGANCSPSPGEPSDDVPHYPLGFFQDGKIVLTSRGEKLFCRSIYLPAATPEAGRIILLVEDMSDNRNLAGRVLEEERLMGVTEIGNTLAHKLNQYLQVIMGYISLMTLEMDPEHAFCEYLNKILEQLENIRRTTYMLSNIHHYAVIERPDGRRMFDLEQAILEAPSVSLDHS